MHYLHQPSINFVLVRYLHDIKSLVLIYMDMVNTYKFFSAFIIISFTYTNKIKLFINVRIDNTFLLSDHQLFL